MTNLIKIRHAIAKALGVSRETTHPCKLGEKNAPLILSILGGDSVTTAKSACAKVISWSKQDCTDFPEITQNVNVRSWMMKLRMVFSEGIVSRFSLQVAPIIPEKRWSETATGLEYLIGFSLDGTFEHPLMARMVSFSSDGICGKFEENPNSLDGWMVFRVGVKPGMPILNEGKYVEKWVRRILDRSYESNINLTPDMENIVDLINDKT